MRIYEIVDEEINEVVGTLLYYEKRRAFIIELKENLDEWTAPLLFTAFVKKHVYSMSEKVSLMWVRERIVPSGRQNIGSILNTHKLKEYDEMKFLELSNGKCSQDNLYIRKIEKLPEYVKERMKKNLIELLVTRSNNLLCFFADDTTRKVELSDIKYEGIEKLQANQQLLLSGKVGVGGYSANFGESIDIPASELYDVGLQIPLSVTDFLDFVNKNIYDTTESCSELECSRQNIAYLQGKYLKPIKENVKGNLFLKGDILRVEW